ncbi:MAG: Ig-like domain-containing protein, partial [Lachnospiraceae bacterium]|nr:Ig-like domain-containing protein [Lachnospiraceae bacterium]
MGRKIRILVYSMILTFLFGSIVVHAAADGGAKITCNDHKTNCTKHTVNIGDDGFKLEMKNLKEGEKPRWISYNVNVARVDQDGNVTPIRKGTAIISSGIGFPRETCTGTVVDPGINLDKT